MLVLPEAKVLLVRHILLVGMGPELTGISRIHQPSGLYLPLLVFAARS